MTLTTLHSSRFGRLEVPSEAVIEFPNGLIGLPGTRWALLARAEDSAFIWLHSVDDAELAIPVTNPWRFFEDFEGELSDEEAERIGITDAEQTSVYGRSEERRVGKEGRSRWSPYHLKKKI